MLLLYEHPVSSYVQKVKIALREKGLPFKAEQPEGFGTERKDGPFADANPRIEVPVLVDGPTRIFEFHRHHGVRRGALARSAAAAARPGGAGLRAHDGGCLRHPVRGGELGLRRGAVVPTRDRRARRRI